VPDIKLPSGGSYIVEPVSVYEYDAYGIARVTLRHPASLSLTSKSRKIVRY